MTSRNLTVAPPFVLGTLGTAGSFADSTWYRSCAAVHVDPWLPECSSVTAVTADVLGSYSSQQRHDSFNPNESRPGSLGRYKRGFSGRSPKTFLKTPSTCRSVKRFKPRLTLLLPRKTHTLIARVLLRKTQAR